MFFSNGVIVIISDRAQSVTVDRSIRNRHQDNPLVTLAKSETKSERDNYVRALCKIL